MTKLITPNRRSILKGAAAGTGALAGAGWVPFIQAQTSEPIKIGFQVHRTGIGAAYGRWYGRTTEAAAALINEAGGINGRQIEILPEDDGTDPRRGAEVVEKFASQYDCDVGFGTLFSHVVTGSAPRAGELKLPYFVVSEGLHVASGALNRYTLQPGITDVKSQIVAMVPWMMSNLGKKVTMIFPDYAFGYNHRDNLPDAVAAEGGEVIAQIAIPPTETSFLKYFARIPEETEIIYHVMVGPGVLTFVKELGEFYGDEAPALFGFVDSIEAVSLGAPGLEFLEGSYFWEGMPRYRQEDSTGFDAFYREKVGVDENGSSTGDAADVSTYSHMFGCWETLYIIKAGMEAAGYQSRADSPKLIEAVEAMTEMPESNEHPQGPKVFNGKTHQVFGLQYISQVQNGKLVKLHTTSLEDGLYPDMVDYTTQPF